MHPWRAGRSKEDRVAGGLALVTSACIALHPNYRARAAVGA